VARAARLGEAAKALGGRGALAALLAGAHAAGRAAGLPLDAEAALRGEAVAGLRAGQDDGVRVEALRAVLQAPPSLVLSGHAASLTPN